MQLFNILLVFHIIAGTSALLSGPVAMVRQDGGLVHRRAGIIFFWGMMVLAFTGVIMSVLHSSLFLLMIGAFSFYLTFTGYRALKLKKLHRGQKAETKDWAALVVCALFGIGMIGRGGYLVTHGESFGIVSMVFGGILMLRIVSDYKRFTKPYTDKKVWLYVHIGNMMGAYIAAFTAFLVQNVHLSPAWIVWLAPTIVLVPVLRLTIAKFRKGKTLPALERAN